MLELIIILMELGQPTTSSITYSTTPHEQCGDTIFEIGQTSLSVSYKGKIIANELILSRSQRENKTVLLLSGENKAKTIFTIQPEIGMHSDAIPTYKASAYNVEKYSIQHLKKSDTKIYSDHSFYLFKCSKSTFDLS